MTPSYLTVIRRDGPLVKIDVLSGPFDPPYAKVHRDDCIEKLFRHPKFGWLRFFDLGDQQTSNDAEAFDDWEATEWLIENVRRVPPELRKLKREIIAQRKEAAKAKAHDEQEVLREISARLERIESSTGQLDPSKGNEWSLPMTLKEWAKVLGVNSRTAAKRFKDGKVRSSNKGLEGTRKVRVELRDLTPPQRASYDAKRTPPVPTEIMKSDPKVT